MPVAVHRRDPESHIEITQSPLPKSGVGGHSAIEHSNGEPGAPSARISADSEKLEQVAANRPQFAGETIIDLRRIGWIDDQVRVQVSIIVRVIRQIGSEG